MEKRGKPLLNEWTSAGRDRCVKGQPAGPAYMRGFISLKRPVAIPLLK